MARQSSIKSLWEDLSCWRTPSSFCNLAVAASRVLIVHSANPYTTTQRLPPIDWCFSTNLLSFSSSPGYIILYCPCFEKKKRFRKKYTAPIRVIYKSMDQIRKLENICAFFSQTKARRVKCWYHDILYYFNIRSPKAVSLKKCLNLVVIWHVLIPRKYTLYLNSFYF